MAERVLTVKIVGNSRDLERSFKRSSASAANFDRSLSRATRGALAGSGVFRSLGRSIAFASGGFLAFASAGQFLRTSIDAAKEAAVTQAQLAAQFRASGKDVKDYQKQIDATANRLSLLAGIENDEIKAGFTTIFRTTGNVTKALRDTATAADLARAKHLSFAQASLIIAKTEAGNTTLLRRQGFQIAKNAKSEEALAKLRRIVAGQARAGTTAQERFGAVLHNTEEIIGTGILPVLNKYLARGATWLTQMNESGELQRDVNAAVKTTGEVFDGLRGVLGPLVQAFKNLGDAVGGTKKEVELLGGAFLLLKLRMKLTGLGLIGTEIAGIGTKSLFASCGVTTLTSRLAFLAKLGAAGIVLNFIPKAKASSNPNAPSRNPVAEAFAGLPIVGGLFSQANKLADKIAHLEGLDKRPDQRAQAVRPLSASSAFLRTTFAQAKLLNPKLTREAFDLGQAVARAFIEGTNVVPPGARKPLAGLSLAGQFNLAELRLAKASLTAISSDDRAILVTEAAIVRQQIEHTKKLKDRTALTQKLASLLDSIRGIDQASADAEKQAAADRKQRLQDAAAAALRARNARQFGALGLGATGGQLIPNAKSLRKDLGKFSDAVSGTFLDTSKTQSVLAKIRRVLAGGMGKLSQDVRSTIKGMLDDLNQQLKDKSTGPVTKFQKANTAKLLAGLGLDPAEVRAVRARLSQLGPGGTVPRSSPGSPAFAGAGAVTLINHNNISIDGKQIAPIITRHQQKQARRNPGQRRGPHAGQ